MSLIVAAFPFPDNLLHIHNYNIFLFLSCLNIIWCTLPNLYLEAAFNLASVIRTFQAKYLQSLLSESVLKQSLCFILQPSDAVITSDCQSELDGLEALRHSIERQLASLDTTESIGTLQRLRRFSSAPDILGFCNLTFKELESSSICIVDDLNQQENTAYRTTDSQAKDWLDTYL